MSDDTQLQTRDLTPKPFAVILGTNEIASAIAVFLNRNGWGVVLSHDPSPPVFRRGMSFHDALFGDRAAIEEIVAQRAENGVEVLSALAEVNAVVVSLICFIGPSRAFFKPVGSSEISPLIIMSGGIA